MEADGQRLGFWREWMRRDRITFALALSLALHVSLYGGYVLGKRLGIVDLPLPKWLRAVTELRMLMPKPLRDLEAALQKPREPEREREVWLAFVDVDPGKAVDEPPPNAKFMSTHSTVAANPNPKTITNDPRIEGKQTQMVKIVEATKPNEGATPKVEEPSPPPPPPKVEPKPPEPRPQPAKAAEKLQVADVKPAPPVIAPGDLVRTKPQPDPQLAQKSGGPQDLQPAVPAPREKPRLLSQVRANNEQGQTIAGQRLIQEGGVPRIGAEGLEVRGSLFGTYDAALVAAVQKRWYDLIADRATQKGKVVVSFRLHQDGRVSDLKAESNDVGEFFGYFCQRAILDPAPFAKWPSDMRRQMEADYRDVRFTFYYN